jgi:dihydroorotase (multifunctional complex type)
VSDRADLVVRNGSVVSSRGVWRGDVPVRSGLILAIPVGRWEGKGSVEIDASGLVVMPGGIDTHVHLMDPGDPERENFAMGTAAAAAAGVTTIIEHTHGWPVTNVSRLSEKLSHLQGRSHVDFGLAAHVWPDQLEDLGPLWVAGVAFFKIFTCTTHGVPGLPSDLLLETLTRISVLDASSLVHCEDERVTAAAERMLREAGRVDPTVLSEWRSRDAEFLAATQVIAAASLTRARTRIAHASNPVILSLVQRARRGGVAVSAETCPQYLLLREGEEESHGALRKFTPPARIRNDGEEARMWAALGDGGVDNVSSDHAPSTKEQKTVDFWEAPFGLPGLDTTFPLLVDGALSGRITLEDVARLYAENPAQHLRLPGKGRIAPGMDADLVLIDPRAQWTISDDVVRSKAAWSPFSGRDLCGKVIRTILRGHTIYSDGHLRPDHKGVFLPGPGIEKGGRPS